MKNIIKLSYLLRLLVGDNWPVLLIGLAIMLIIAYKNCFCTRTGRVFYRRENGLFVFLSSVAGFFHFVDLIHSWFRNELVLIEDTVCDNARALSVVIAMLFGLVIGTLFYVFTQFVMFRRSEFMERRYFLSHMRSLRNYSSYDSYRNYSRY